MYNLPHNKINKMLRRTQAFLWYSFLYSHMSIHLVNTSFVFIVEVSSPAFFNSSYLMKLGVIPEDASIATAVTLPVFSQVSYNDQYIFEAREHRVSLTRDIAIPTEPTGETYSIDALTLSGYLRDAASKMIEGLKPFRLESVGINFGIFVPNADLSRFLTSMPPELQGTSLQFFTNVQGLQANYTLSSVTTAVQTSPINGVLIDANFDGQLSEEAKFDEDKRAEGIAGLIDKRDDFFDSLKGTLNVLNFK